jgi:hypothetical protein
MSVHDEIQDGSERWCAVVKTTSHQPSAREIGTTISRRWLISSNGTPLTIIHKKFCNWLNCGLEVIVWSASRTSSTIFSFPQLRLTLLIRSPTDKHVFPKTQYFWFLTTQHFRIITFISKSCLILYFGNNNASNALNQNILQHQYWSTLNKTTPFSKYLGTSATLDLRFSRRWIRRWLSSRL